MKTRLLLTLALMLMLVVACGPGPAMPSTMPMPPHNIAAPSPTEAEAEAGGGVLISNPTAEDVTVEYTLRTAIGGDPVMAYVGVGGDIDGIVNPLLTAEVGDVVQVTVINGDPVLHDWAIDAFPGAHTEHLTEQDQTDVVIFQVTAPGDFKYYCTIPGHEQAGMLGTLRVTGEVIVGDSGAMDDSIYTGDMADHNNDSVVTTVNPAVENTVSIIRHPADVPPPIGDREPTTLVVEMTTIEVTGQLADGTTFNYFTFDGQVPGPMLRMMVGDTMEFYLTNADGSLFPHSIDLHAVTGPGGGAVYTQTVAGETTSFSFKALNPGLYVYHCATASIPHHIASGMYGLILVEPEGGLPPVDKEFYVMQGEIYTVQPFGTAGHLDFSFTDMSYEKPEYFVFNGAAGGLTSDEYAMFTDVGDTVRIFFGVGGPNFTSSFHVIGEIFDRVYDQASITSPPLTDVQTTLVPPGGATMVEFKMDVPGRYILVDHALSRLERGLVAFLYANGDADPDIFHSDSDLSDDSDH